MQSPFPPLLSEIALPYLRKLFRVRNQALTCQPGIFFPLPCLGSHCTFPYLPDFLLCFAPTSELQTFHLKHSIPLPVSSPVTCLFCPLLLCISHLFSLLSRPGLLLGSLTHPHNETYACTLQVWCVPFSFFEVMSPSGLKWCFVLAKLAENFIPGVLLALSSCFGVIRLKVSFKNVY